jgi:hypothetical protein
MQYKIRRWPMREGFLPTGEGGAAQGLLRSVRSFLQAPGLLFAGMSQEVGHGSDENPDVLHLPELRREVIGLKGMHEAGVLPKSGTEVSGAEAVKTT